MRTGTKRQLITAAFALLLAIAALALIAPALTAPANQQQPKTIQQTQGEQGIRAPMQRIEPVSVAVVNFQKLAEAEAKKKVSGLEEKAAQVEVPAPMTIPEPVELGANQFPAKESRPEAKAEVIGPSLVSPGPASNFVAQLDEPKVGIGSRTIPPDTTGAVGPTKIFSNLNSNYRVQDKTTGTTLSTVAINTFWEPLNSATPGPSPTPSSVANVFDPRIQYDPYNGRWIVAAASNGKTASASILVGISSTSDPQGTFTLFRFVVGCAADPQGLTCNTNGEWADFPMLGFNKNWVAVGWNQFGSTNSAFLQGKMLILSYPALLTGTSSSSIFAAAASSGFCMHPATTLSPTEETLYVPAHFNSTSATYRLHRITGTAGAPVFTFDGFSHTRGAAGTWTQPGGDILPQTCVGTVGTNCPTTLRFIDSADAHIRSNVIFRNGSIWYAQTIGLPAGGPLTRTAAQWTRIDTNGTFVDGGRVDDPSANSTSGQWYAYPSIAVNANNDVLLGFSNFSATHFANAGYTFRAGTDAVGTMRDPVIMKAGEDYYSKSFNQPDPEGGRNRWGDYSHSVVDPSNDLDMWTIQEYAGMRTVQDSLRTTNASRWGTWWARISDIGSPPPSPTPTISPTPPPTPPPAPANDNFANAQTISGCSGSVNGTNLGATRETGEPRHDPANNSGSASVWYQWTAPASASVTITTINSDFDTLLGVYTGTAVNSLTACPSCRNDDIDTQQGNVQSSVTFTAVSGTVYKIAVDGWCCAGDEVGNIVLNWSQSNCAPSSLGVEQNTTQLAAVDSVTLVRGPFTLNDDHNFSGDHRTRIIFFTSDLGFAQPTQNPDVNNTLAVVINGTSYPVESVGPSSTPPGSYVVFFLPNLAPGTYPVSLKVRGVTSANSPTITIAPSPNGPVANSSPSLMQSLYPLVRLLL